MLDESWCPASPVWHRSGHCTSQKKLSSRVSGSLDWKSHRHSILFVAINKDFNTTDNNALKLFNDMLWVLSGHMIIYYCWLLGLLYSNLFCVRTLRSFNCLVISSTLLIHVSSGVFQTVLSWLCFYLFSFCHVLAL